MPRFLSALLLACASLVAAEPLLLPRPASIELGEARLQTTELKVWQAEPAEFAKAARILSADGTLKVSLVSEESKRPVKIVDGQGNPRTLMGAAFFSDLPVLRISGSRPSATPSASSPRSSTSPTARTTSSTRR